MSRKVVILAIVVIVVCVGWSGFWWLAASTADEASADAIQQAQARGIDVDCSERAISGYPFRLTLTCTSLSLANERLVARSSGLRAVALVYDPRNLIVEADTPAAVEIDGLGAPVEADWSSGRASVKIGTQIIDQVSIAFKDIALTSPAFSPISGTQADRFEVHARRSEEPADLDIALLSRSVATAMGSAQLPVFDLDIAARLTDGAHLLLGRHKVFLDLLKSGESDIDLVRALATIGEAKIEISGRFSLSPEGYLNGDPKIAIANPQALGEALTQVPGLASIRLGPFLSVLSGLGQPGDIDGTPARTMTLSVRDGYVTAGLVPLGRMKSLLR